ncbi:MAG TPA: helix-turn-helix domain-containing protein [Naasia sp.]|jgi:excisionase family DNA binding protein
MTTMYSVHVELDRRDPTPEYLEQLLELTQHLHAAVGTSPRGWVDAQISLPAESLQQATLMAVATLQQLAGATAIAVEVMTEKEFDARQGFATVPDLLSVSEVAEILGVTRQRVHQLIDERVFPSATKVGTGTVIARSDVFGKIRSAVYSHVRSAVTGIPGELLVGDDGLPKKLVERPADSEGEPIKGTWRFVNVDAKRGVAIYGPAPD